MAIKIQGVEIISDAREITGLKFGPDSITLPSSDGTSGQVIQTDGLGTLRFASLNDISTYISDVVEDTTPQLGGNLDVNGFSIVGPSANNIVTVDSDLLKVTGTLGDSTNVVSNAYINKIHINDVGQIFTGSYTSSSTNTFNLVAVQASTVRSFKIVIQASNTTSGYYYTSELLCMHDGTNAYSTEYATLDTTPNEEMIIVTPVLSAGLFILKITPSTADTIQYKVLLQQISV